MVSSRVIATATAVVSLGAAAPAMATDDASPPPARMAGGGATATLVSPSLVGERLVRVQTALDRAAAAADEHQPDAAATTLMRARANLRKAWSGARWVIENAPPPVTPPDDAFAAPRFHPGAFTRAGRLRIPPRRVRRAGDAPAGGVASIYDTAYAVLSLQHRMATLATGLLDTAHGTFTGSLNTSLFTALDGRDAAIAYLHSIDAPAPPPPDDVVANAAGAPVATSGWAGVMPNLTGLLDDELQQITGTIAIGGVSLKARHILQDALAQDTSARNAVDRFWPPLPPVDD
jgi:hypothetical protein